MKALPRIIGRMKPTSSVEALYALIFAVCCLLALVLLVA
jgi:hypothetical protein